MEAWSASVLNETKGVWVGAWPAPMLNGTQRGVDHGGTEGAIGCMLDFNLLNAVRSRFPETGETASV